MAEGVRKDADKSGHESGPRRWRWTSSPTIPFVATDSSMDLALAFALLPLWWALGLSQLVWAPLALFLYLKRAMMEKKLDHVRLGTLAALGLFLVSYLATTSVLWASGFLSSESSLMFYYEELMAVAAGVFLVLAADCAASSEGERLRVVIGIGAMGLGACAMGVLPYLGLELSYEAPVRFLLPEGLPLSRTGGISIYNWSVEKSLGSTRCFFGYEMFRPKSLFTYATLYAAAMVMVAPLQLYLARRSGRVTWRLLWGVGALVSVAGLLLTTARVALAALVVAGLVVALGWAAWAFVTRRVSRARLLLGLSGLLIAGVAALAVGPWAAGAAASVVECGEQGSGYAVARESLLSEDSNAASLLQAAALEARGGSLKDRLEVYRATLEVWKERPWIGFGTLRDSPDLRYPLGSLSTYLGTLFQRGAVGLAALLVLMGYVFYRLGRGLRRSRPGVHRPFLVFAAVSLLAGSLAGLTDALDLDATVQVLFWTLMGLVIGTSFTARGEKEPGERGSGSPS